MDCTAPQLLLLLLYGSHVYTCDRRSDLEGEVVAQIDGSDAQAQHAAAEQPAAVPPCAAHNSPRNGTVHALHGSVPGTKR